MWWTGKKPEEHLPFATLPDAKVCSMLYPMCAPLSSAIIHACRRTEDTTRICSLLAHKHMW
jgi:hypothetical protein